MMDDELTFPPLQVTRIRMMRADVAENRIAELETEVARLQREREDMRIGRMEECESLRAEAVKAVRRAEEAEREAEALRAALTDARTEMRHIESWFGRQKISCYGLNRAILTASAALSHYNGNKEQ